MKTVIIFLSLLTIHLGLLVYQSDANRVYYLEKQASRLARECAAGAVGLFDEEAFAMGKMELNQVEIEKYRRDLLGKVKDGSLGVKKQNIDLTVNITELSGNQIVIATAKYWEDDFFRLPFLEKNMIEKQISYSVEGRMYEE